MKIKLYYFNARGRAELIRLILVTVSEPFEDIRFELDKWPEYKKIAPLSQAPFIEIIEDSKQVFRLGQSLSIARYLARKFNLAGQSPEEQAEVESYGDLLYDLQNEMLKTRYEKDETRKVQMNNRIYNEHLPRVFKLLDEAIGNSQSGFLAKSGNTWSDLYLFEVLEMLGDKREVIVNKYQNIKDMETKIRRTPNIVEWLISRPKTDF
nr:glutathione S-transferase sigma 2 [Brachionus rubens]